MAASCVKARTTGRYTEAPTGKVNVLVSVVHTAAKGPLTKPVPVVTVTPEDNVIKFIAVEIILPLVITRNPVVALPTVNGEFNVTTAPFSTP